MNSHYIPHKKHPFKNKALLKMTKQLHRFPQQLLLLIVIVTCFNFSSAAKADDIILTSSNNNWTYYQTHDASIDLSSVKASDWKPADVPGIFIKDPSNGIYIWYKKNFTVTTEALKIPENQTLSLFMESMRNSDETWLNGTKIGGVGDISPAWDIWQIYPLNIPRVYELPAGLLKVSNTLFIKANTGVGNIRGTEYFGSVGITGEVKIQETSQARESQYKINLKSNIIDVLIIALGLIDVFLIIFLFKNTFNYLPEFPWLLINSILMIAATLMLDVFYFNDIKHPFYGVIRYITVFSIPYATALYFWSQNKNIAKKVVIAFGIIQLIMAIFVLSPAFADSFKAFAWKVTLVLFVSCFLYSIFTATVNLRRKQVGSLTQIIGLSVYLFSVRTDIFNVDLFEHHSVYLGSLFFRYTLLFAYFQRIRHMSASYKKLSKRMLGTIEEKRSEMARELHDSLGKHLASSKFQAQLASSSGDSKHLSNVTDEINLAIRSMHRLVQGLHPMTLDRHHLHKAIQLETQRLERNHPIKFKLNLHRDELPKEVEVHLFRIFQESVNNSLRHGKATKIEIKSWTTSNKLHFSIKDNGLGYDTKKPIKNKDQEEGGFGLISLKERVHLINGNFYLSSIPKKGTELIIEIPYNKNHAK